MSANERLNSPEEFATALYAAMQDINGGIADLHPLEFRYALENLLPETGWEAVPLDSPADIERRIGQRDFYESIQLKPRRGERIALDAQVQALTQMLLVGLVQGYYSPAWLRQHFYFDVRGFFFLPRTLYFTNPVREHFGGQPVRQFAAPQQAFERHQAVGYRDFLQANAEIDAAFIESVKAIIAQRGTPILITLAGPTAAGKTEITGRLLEEFERLNYRVTTIEVDNFLLDREEREDKPMGKESTHFDFFIRSLQQVLQGQKVSIPRYDFVNAVSSHNRDGSLRPGHTPMEIEPADVIFMEGNFPFHIEEVARLIGIKVVYLTDDPIRLKRKWKRDIDYRKKYDPAYFRNRFFRTQFLRAEEIYRPLMQVCDIVVDTTGAALWVTPDIAAIMKMNLH